MPDDVQLDAELADAASELRAAECPALARAVELARERLSYKLECAPTQRPEPQLRLVGMFGVL